MQIHLALAKNLVLARKNIVDLQIFLHLQFVPNLIDQIRSKIISLNPFDPIVKELIMYLRIKVMLVILSIVTNYIYKHLVVNKLWAEVLAYLFTVNQVYNKSNGCCQSLGIEILEILYIL